MKRNALVLTVIVAGICLMLWAGWHNLRERRLALERAQANHMMMMPPQTGSAAGSAATSEDTDPKETSLQGKAAPAFTLVNLEGKKVSLKDYKGRPVLVNFWATWCSPCKLEMPWFEEFRQKYGPQGFEILGIVEDDAGKDVIAKAVKRINVSYPILLPDQKVAPAYGGVDYLPESFYVDRNGIVQTETSGLGSKDEIEANIKRLIGTVAAAPGAKTGSVSGQ
ncbi:MAG TPA: TlpA disulfide reductase family protein [Granulicella sp.]|nr:TlpA disulfide reductase family protein [Granulicella sp.]